MFWVLPQAQLHNLRCIYMYNYRQSGSYVPINGNTHQHKCYQGRGGWLALVLSSPTESSGSRWPPTQYPPPHKGYSPDFQSRAVFIWSKIKGFDIPEPLITLKENEYKHTLLKPWYYINIPAFCFEVVCFLTSQSAWGRSPPLPCVGPARTRCGRPWSDPGPPYSAYSLERVDPLLEHCCSWSTDVLAARQR